ncbi:hypothetical protein R3P38DRAFT_3288347 [Favolaschia claudopus]|uniref:DUF6532 domain-containing protein n=1 Tax=Favolaschia claudopus TaxID=2862362 RepID=A0AAV9ZWT1_9AGAR
MAPPLSLTLSTKTHKRKKAEAPLAKAEFVAGKAPGGTRTNLKHYTETSKKLIQRAQHIYEVHIWTRAGYPGVELQVQVGKEIWDRVCMEAKSPTELTDRMLNMITKYGVHARSSLRDKVRPHVAGRYQFMAGDSDKIKKRNVKKHKMLLGECMEHGNHRA